ncbi:UPF0481 protein At3g47200-like [Benincasa hispida]|uniref:UPF0481 protein At3g47200-like n=1 Tax=Benincasa hispida TaxID=102211 RepID=UPI001900A615|nr:UPF0481 protein At3g47200-like [Benincasa hispida]
MEIGRNQMHQPNNAEIKARSYNMATLIQAELRRLPFVTEECCIHRVSKRLLNIHRTAYEPQLISIGPFHHGRKDLKPMEQFKLQFLRRFIARINRQRLSYKDVVETALMCWETRARNCYEDFANNMNSHDFVRMMLVDGCFIVEFLVSVYGICPQTQSTSTSRVDPLVFKAMNINLYHDLIMLENQLPFFVLQDLFDLIIRGTDNSFTLVDILHKFFGDNFMKHNCETPQNKPPKENIRHLVYFLCFYYSPTNGDIIECNNNKSLLLPPSITELHEAGVILEKGSTDNILNVTFKDGVLKIPPFEIHGLFEIYMRNLMAFENFQGVNGNQSYAIHYVLFLGALISREKDSSLLMKKGIITNLIGGSDEEVSNMFNNIGKGVTFQGHFYYEDVSKDLHKHCKTRRNRWMASLRRDYCNTPWATISLLAAIFVTFFIFLQTIFSGIRFGMNPHMYHI